MTAIIITFTWIEKKERENITHCVKIITDDKSQIDEYVKKQGWQGNYEIVSEEEVIYPIVLKSNISRLAII